MIRSVLYLTSILLALPCAQARLGETPYQCQQRYSEALKKVPSFIVGSDPDAELFRKDNVDIRIHYKNGRAWHISYIKPGMVDGDRQIFLRANAGMSGWPNLAGQQIMGQIYWVSHTDRRAAVAYSVGREGIMEIMTTDCVKALGDDREQRIHAALRDAVGVRARAAQPKPEAPKKEPSPAAKPDQPKGDPLKGF
jgi:hypothetical protein